MVACWSWSSNTVGPKDTPEKQCIVAETFTDDRVNIEYRGYKGVERWGKNLLNCWIFTCLILLDGMSIGPRRSPSLGQQSSKPAGRRNFQTGDSAAAATGGESTESGIISPQLLQFEFGNCSDCIYVY